MREYGGYMTFEEFHGEEYYEDLYRMDSVRSSIAVAIKARGYKKFYIPYYLCGCMDELFERLNMPVEYYRIDKAFMPCLGTPVEKDACVLIVNYFGQIDNSAQYELQKKFGNIFVDNTQAFYQRPAKGIDTASSCRKFFGLPDGAYFNTDIKKQCIEELPYDIASEHLLYGMGRMEEGANAHYSGFVKNDELPRGIPAKQMSKLVRNILKGLDYERIISMRETNFDRLDAVLRDTNGLKIKNRAGLYLYPYFTENGQVVKKKLVQNKIYVPTLWPEVMDKVAEDTYEYKLAKNLVLLPIDHRYNEQDMDYILEVLETCMH